MTEEPKEVTLTIQLPPKEATLISAAAQGCNDTLGHIIGYMIQHFKHDLIKMAGK